MTSNVRARNRDQFTVRLQNGLVSRFIRLTSGERNIPATVSTAMMMTKGSRP